MVDPFNKLPGFTKAPPGLERKILRLLPRVFVFGSMLVAMPALLMRLLPLLMADAVTFKQASTIDILSLGVMIVFWIGLVIVANGAFVVMIMKGPAYVADPYALVDSDKPRKD